LQAAFNIQEFYQVTNPAFKLTIIWQYLSASK